MELLQAADYLRRKVREDDDVKLMVAAAVTASGCADLFDWAEKSPEQVTLLAESVMDLLDQTDEFERRLATGDLS